MSVDKYESAEQFAVDDADEPTDDTAIYGDGDGWPEDDGEGEEEDLEDLDDDELFDRLDGPGWDEAARALVDRGVPAKEILPSLDRGQLLESYRSSEWATDEDIEGEWEERGFDADELEQDAEREPPGPPPAARETPAPIPSSAPAAPAPPGPPPLAPMLPPAQERYFAGVWATGSYHLRSRGSDRTAGQVASAIGRAAELGLLGPGYAWRCRALIGPDYCRDDGGTPRSEEPYWEIVGRGDALRPPDARELAERIAKMPGAVRVEIYAVPVKAAPKAQVPTLTPEAPTRTPAQRPRDARGRYLPIPAGWRWIPEIKVWRTPSGAWRDAPPRDLPTKAPKIAPKAGADRERGKPVWVLPDGVKLKDVKASGRDPSSPSTDTLRGWVNARLGAGRGVKLAEARAVFPGVKRGSLTRVVAESRKARKGG